MRIKTKNIISLTKARKNFFDIAKKAQKYGNHYMFTYGGKPKIVVMSADEYDSFYKKDREKCKKCGSEKIILVEYAPGSPERYDGISEIDCLVCKARFGRWSGKELAKGEVEKRFGGK